MFLLLVLALYKLNKPKYPKWLVFKWVLNDSLTNCRACKRLLQGNKRSVSHGTPGLVCCHKSLAFS